MSNQVYSNLDRKYIGVGYIPQLECYLSTAALNVNNGGYSLIPYDVVVTNEISGKTGPSFGQITLPPGTYRIDVDFVAQGINVAPVTDSNMWDVFVQYGDQTGADTTGERVIGHTRVKCLVGTGYTFYECTSVSCILKLSTLTNIAVWVFNNSGENNNIIGKLSGTYYNKLIISQLA